MPSDQSPPARTGPRKLLRCDGCGRSTVFTDAEFFDAVENGWLQCCGETMALFLEATVGPAAGGRPDPER